MQYREHPPSPDLAPFVRCFWTLKGRAEGEPERLLPDGRTELVIHLGDPFDRLHANGHRERQQRALFVGQLDTHVTLAPLGFISVLGACFHPDGASAFAHWPQSETAGMILPLEDLWGSPARSLEDAVRNAESHDGRVPLIENFLRDEFLPFDDSDSFYWSEQTDGICLFFEGLRKIECDMFHCEIAHIPRGASYGNAVPMPFSGKR